MLLSIGRGPKATGDLVDALLACHERIRRFVKLAHTVGERVELAAADATDACVKVERYFVEAFPLHVRDEEESLLPRLRGQRGELDAALASMHEEHVAHDRALRELLTASEDVRREPTEAARRVTLRAAAERMMALFDEHLRREEEIVFPAVRASLSLDEQKVVLDEFRGRRAAS